MKACFARLNANASFASFSSFIKDAEEKYIVPLIGESLYTEINTWYNTAPLVTNAEKSSLLAQLQRPLTFYTLLEAGPSMLLDMGDEGIMEGSVDNANAPRQWTVKNLMEYLSANADTFAESVLQFLEKKATDYPTWNGSDFRKEARSLFISSGKMWKDAGADIDQPHRFFLNRINSIKRVEDTIIQDIIGTELQDALRQKLKDGNPTEAETKLIEKIRPVVAYHALADSIPRVSFTISSSGVRILNEHDGITQKNLAGNDVISARVQDNLSLAKRYEQTLRKFLIDNKSDYPLWPVPETYTDAGAVYQRPDNKGKRSFSF